MKCMVIVAVAVFAVIVPADAQAPRLKAVLSACMAQAVLLDPLPTVANDSSVLIYGCEGKLALALFNAMELVSTQTTEGNVIARRAGNVVCSRHKTQDLMICTLTVQATAPFVQQVR
jgi:hypothetical protein